MAIKIYNTLSRKKEIFKPIKPGNIDMYVCGPTVYGPGHLGHARTYLAFDIIRRWLEHENYKVKYIINITDIHDDIKPGTDTKKITNKFLDDLSSLNIKPADKYPKVSEHIKEIKNLIDILLDKKFAYKVKDNIYFDVSKFKDYGKLSGRKLDKNLKNTRIKSDKYERDEVADFALWKGDRPGWHIECSAMSKKYLGEQIDIHAGALDLIFPHHENEIAQSESANNKKFVNYWMHGGLLEIDGKKMSKSLNNYIKIPDIEDKRVFRFFILQHHYRSPLNYTKKALKQAESALEKLDFFPNGNVDISAEMNDDFNTPKALAKIFKAKKWPPEMETVFGIKRKKEKPISLEIKKLIKEREQARKQKNWLQADKLRAKARKLGFQVKDLATLPNLFINPNRKSILCKVARRCPKGSSILKR